MLLNTHVRSVSSCSRDRASAAASVPSGSSVLHSDVRASVLCREGAREVRQPHACSLLLCARGRCIGGLAACDRWRVRWGCRLCQGGVVLHRQAPRTALRFFWVRAVVMTALIGVERGASDRGDAMGEVSSRAMRCAGASRPAWVSGPVHRSAYCMYKHAGRTWCGCVGGLAVERIGAEAEQLLQQGVRGYHRRGGWSLRVSVCGVL